MFTNKKEILLNINRIIFSSLDIREVYQTMSNELLKVIDFDRLSVTLITENNNLYETFVLSKDYEYTELKEGVQYPMEGSLMKRVVQFRQPVIVEDTSKGRFLTDPVLYKEGIHSRLGYPLEHKGRVIGSVNFGSKRKDYYSKKHITFFSQIAPQLAMAIENTRLFNRIKEAEEKYRTVIESSPDIIFECTKDGEFLLMSPSVEKITGYPANQFYENRGYGLSLCHEEDQERVQHEILQVLHGQNNSLMDIEFRVIHKQGHVVWLSLEMLPMKQNNDIIGIEGFCRNITERKKLDELKDNLIRDVTHELKTPVAKIEMAIDMFERAITLGDKSPLGKGSQIHEIFRNNINRLKNTIRNILDISKLESGVESLKLSDISIADLIQQIVYEQKDSASTKNNVLAHQLPSGIPIIKADRDMIYHLINHLVDNAIKFTEHGKIIIMARVWSDAVEVTVEDTGRGLDEKTRERVFEKFYKETPSAFGAGIGLAICKNIVQKHKGRIWVESEGKGKGSRFKFTLPILVDTKQKVTTNPK
ncbi:MAG TPA: GAF domain-containing sensor histidine kinase [Candidatus Wunengus sp. YC61]|uniref:GAF domain-containing sensor histidine kinase n=1 Tax=Candidatus Wunengus sp. YC61 TaxID=3367698 RepID=UPI0040298D5A